MTQNQKFSFFMGPGIQANDTRYAQWRAIELVFDRFLSAADQSRRYLLADKLSHHQATGQVQTILPIFYTSEIGPNFSFLAQKFGG